MFCVIILLSHPFRLLFVLVIHATRVYSNSFSFLISYKSQWFRLTPYTLCSFLPLLSLFFSFSSIYSYYIVYGTIEGLSGASIVIDFQFVKIVQCKMNFINRLKADALLSHQIKSNKTDRHHFGYDEMIFSQNSNNICWLYWNKFSLKHQIEPCSRHKRWYLQYNSSVLE